MHLTASLGELAIFVSGRTTEIWWPPEVCLLVCLLACAPLPTGWGLQAHTHATSGCKIGATAYALDSHQYLCPVSMSWLASLCTVGKVAVHNNRHPV